MLNGEGEAPYHDIYERIKADIAEARMRYENRSFSVVDLFGERVQDLVDGAPDYKKCYYQEYVTYIGGDARPFRCCVYAYSKRGLIADGDLSQTPFDEFWSSEAKKKDFEDFDARQCGQCQFNGKNRAMNYLLSDDPSHVEFP